MSRAVIQGNSSAEVQLCIVERLPVQSVIQLEIVRSVRVSLGYLVLVRLTHRYNPPSELVPAAQQACLNSSSCTYIGTPVL